MKTPTIISPKADKSTSELLRDTNMIRKYNLDVTWPEIWSYSQYSDFKDNYTWLISSKGKLGCDFCSTVKSLGVIKRERLHISEEWSDCLMEATEKDRASKLSHIRNKVKKHVNSESHKLAENAFKEGQKKRLKETVNTMNILAEEATIKVFRTAYYLAMKNRQFSDHEDLIRLQQAYILVQFFILDIPQQI